MRCPALLAALVLPLSLTVAPAAAQDWPVFRHDARRTAATSVPTPVDRPAVLFRTYLGGALGPQQIVDLDVDADGRAELVYVSGGRVVAKRGNNLAVWESEILPVDRLWGPVDLDEDGSTDLLLTRTWPAPSEIAIVSSRDGSVLWRMPRATTDWLGGVRVGDLDGDGHLDLYAGTGMCGTGVTGPPGTAFSFCDASGCSYASARTLWNLAMSPAGNCGAGGALGDTDGDGAAELVIPWDYSQVPVHSAVTGALEGGLPSFASGNYDRATTTVFLRNIDGDPALEIVAWTNSFNAGQGARRVAVLDYAAGAYRLLWEHAGADRANDRVVIDAPGSLADLDGDGTLELAVGRRIGSTWTSTVHDALTGALIATLPGAVELTAVADVTGDARPELFASAGSELVAFQLDPGGSVRELWRLPGRFVPRVEDAARRPADPTPSRAFTMQLDGDAAPELLLGERDANGRFVALHAYDADGATPVLKGSLRAPDGVSILVTAEVAAMTRDYPQPVVATSDGYLLILDRALAVTNRVVSIEFEEPGMRVGGFYTGVQGPSPTALVGQLAAGAPRVVVPDSRGALVVLDATAASPTAAPRVVDELAGARWASLIDVDGSPPLELCAYQGNDLVIHRASGDTRQALATAGFLADPLPLAAPAGRRIAITRMDASGRIAIALASSTLAELWSAAPRLPGWGTQNHGLSAVADLNGDGTEDVVTAINSVHALDGTSGAALWDNGSFMAGGDPLVVGTRVFAHGAWQPTRMLEANGGARWTLAGGTQVNAYGAQVTCGGAAALVAGESGSAELVTVRESDGGVIANRIVAGGESYEPGTVPAGVSPGIATNVTSLASLAGAPALLAGSTDGYLYALDPCTLALRWSLDLRYPVGEPIAADLDGDGSGEILVSVADGYLYGVTGAAYDAPAVRDTEPGMPLADVDEIDTRDTLYAAWDAVPGATSYLVSVFTEYGSEVRFPNVTDAGNVTQVAIPMLQLAQGARYVVAVQAVGPAGPGLEGRSDGVVLRDTRPPEPTVRVSPDPSWPAGGVPPVVDASCADRVGLTRMTVRIEREDGGLVVQLSDRPLTGQITMIAADRFEDASAPAGRYVARVTCIDTSALEASATASFTLDPAAVVADAGPPPRDGGGAGPPASGGCGCRAAPAPSRLGALAGLGLWLAMRRRRAR